MRWFRDAYINIAFIYLLNRSIPNIIYWILYHNKTSSPKENSLSFILNNSIYACLTFLFIFKIGWAKGSVISLIAFWVCFGVCLLALILYFFEKRKDKKEQVECIVRVLVCVGMWYFLVR